MSGLLTNKELINSIINDLNEYLKAQASGQMLQAAAIMAGVSQKLLNLYRTVNDDLKNRDKTIDSLKQQLRAAGVEVIDVPPEKLEKVVNE